MIAEFLAGLIYRYLYSGRTLWAAWKKKREGQEDG